MTAEVAIMNKQAVALATDSAATIGGKIFNNNKLFTLSKWQPIGVMVYGYAEIMGYPWETIIKMYRESLGKKCFKNLQYQVKDFLEYLQKFHLFNEEAEKNYMETTFDLILNDIFVEMNRRSSESNDTARNLLVQIIKDFNEKNNFFKKLPKSFERFSISGTDKQNIVNKYKNTSKRLVSEAFKNYNIDKKIQNDICLIMNDVIFHNQYSSGLVFSGFGTDEIFPTTINLNISGVIKSKIIMSNYSEVSINVNNDAAIIPFAQRDEVDSFMSGIDRKLSYFIEDQTEKLLKELINSITLEIKVDKELFRKSLIETLNKGLSNMWEGVGKFTQVEYMKPILNGVSSLPPDELASMAEALVNLTSFKRKIYANQRETVGGPTDVAVITKGDGFVWIKRKLYFKSDINRYFFDKYLYLHDTESNSEKNRSNKEML